MSSGEVIIWGEPLGDAAFLPRTGKALSTLTDKWPYDHFFDADSSLDALSNQWVANLTPPMHHLKSAHRALLEQWMREPAMTQYGVERWGFKEVRLTIDHARYLKWLFPKARFLFIYRNLFDAYRSWKGNWWGLGWPGYHSTSPVVFARHRRHLLDGFVDGYKEVDGLFVKFEDLM